MRLRFFIGPMIAVPDAGWEMWRVADGTRLDQSTMMIWLALIAFWATWSAITPWFGRQADRRSARLDQSMIMIWLALQADRRASGE